MTELRNKIIQEICAYLNSKFKNATIKYENESFIIEGDTEESEEIKAYIEDLIEFSRGKEYKTEKMELKSQIEWMEEDLRQLK